MSDGIYSSLLGNCKELRCAQAEESEGLKERDGLRGRRRVESVTGRWRKRKIERYGVKTIRGDSLR